VTLVFSAVDLEITPEPSDEEREAIVEALADEAPAPEGPWLDDSDES
jgi:hypothetical protein